VNLANHCDDRLDKSYRASVAVSVKSNARKRKANVERCEDWGEFGRGIFKVL
jgi:hypothetical protein